MRGNKKLALIGMAIILSLSLLAFGLGTTVFAADTENGEEPNVFETFVSKVADKLGLEDEVVADAMQEARQEMMQERLQERLQQAIDEGLITQEQADEITTWLEDRPEAHPHGRPDHARRTLGAGRPTYCLAGGTETIRRDLRLV